MKTAHGTQRKPIPANPHLATLGFGMSAAAMMCSGSCSLFLLTALLALPARAQMQLVPSITTVAGNGSTGYSGDGGLAISAQMNYPTGAGFDSVGNYYITEYVGCRVRKVTKATGNISTVAGTGTCGNAGDGGQATSTMVNHPNHRVAFDSAGNFYFAESFNNKIRKVNISTGVISTVAGTGTACSNPTGACGDGSAATSAQLNNPGDVLLDSAGNIYIADSGDNKIRKVNASTRYISTVAGTGTAGSLGDGGAATSAQLNSPQTLNLDSAGNIYIADYQNNRVRKVTISNGSISTVAGTGAGGYTGDGGAATSAQITAPYGPVFDSAGNFYFSDAVNLRVRKVNIGTGIITTVAGTGSSGNTGNGGPATNANLNYPNGLAVDSSDNLYIADAVNAIVRMVKFNTTFPTTAVGSSSAVQNFFLQTTAAETLTSITAQQSQNSKQEYSVGTITGCTVNGFTSNPIGTFCTVPVTFKPAYPGPRTVPLTAVTGTGKVTFGLTGTGTGPLAALTPGTISTVAGNGTAGSTGNGGPATSAQLNDPVKLAVDSGGNIYISNYNNHDIQKVTASSGNISIVAGNGTAGYSGDGSLATSAQLKNPSGVGIDSAGNIYIADKKNCRIRKVTAATGIIATVAGTGTCAYSGDGGLATNAQLNFPSSNIAFDSDGNWYFGDNSNFRVREVNASTGIITTVAGNGTAGYTGDGGAATNAELHNPSGIALDSSDNIYIADFSEAVIRKVTASTGIISTVAGNGTTGYWGDGGAAINAEIQFPGGVDVDTAGNIYIPDSTNNRIRVVNVASGTISTIAGNGTAGYGGDGGAATSDELNSPQDIALDGFGNLYIADSANNRIRQVSVSGTSLTYATSTMVGTLDGTDDPQVVTVTNIGNAGLTVSVPNSGTNPSVSNYFVLDNSTSCPELNTLSSAGMLPQGAACIYGVNFAPTAAGSILGSVVLTDNSLNISGSMQTISLIGTAIAVNTTTTVASPANPSTYMGSVTFTATVAPVSGSAVPSGTVQFKIDGSNVGGPVTLSSGSATYTTSTLAAGTHSIVAVYTTNSSNYNSSTSSTLTQTVNKATPTVSAWPTAGAITYGQTLASSTLSGGTASVSGTFTWTTPSTVPGAGTPPESVTFTPTDTTDYNTPAAGNISVTVNKATPTVSAWPTASAITYGQTLASSTLSGGTASVSGTFAWTTPSTGPGTGTPPESVTFIPTDTTDYNTPAAGSTSVTVNKAPLTITASSPTVSYGAAVPTVTPSYSGFVNSQNSSVLTTQPTCTTTYAVTSTAGSSPSTSCSGAAATNYSIAYVAGAVTVNKAPLTITASSPTVNYGFSVPTITASYSGFVNSQNSSVMTTQPTCTTTYTVTSAAGSSPSTSCSGAAAANYSIGYVAGAVTVSQAPLTITASSPTVSYGAAPPTITPSFSGFMNGQNSSVLAIQPTCTTAYAVTSAAGSSPLTSCSGAAAANYSMSYVAGAVTVNKATPSVTWPTPTAITYGTALSSTQLSATAGGVAGSFVYTPASGTVLNAGSQTLSVNFNPTDTADYNAASSSVTLTVNKATPTLSVATSGTPITYGTLVTFTATISSGPIGAITFYDSGISIGTGTISGTSAPFATSTLTAGTHTITVGWGGNGNYNSIISGSITQTVNKATPIIIWPTPAPITYGSPLSSDQLNATSGGVAGSFAYTPPVGTVLGAGSQSLSLTFTPTDSTDYVSAASNVSLTVNKSSVVIVGAALSTPSYFGDRVTLTFTFTGAGLTPTGTTTIKDGAVTLVTIPLSAGAATFSTSALGAGTHSLTATYNGDVNYQ